VTSEHGKTRRDELRRLTEDLGEQALSLLRQFTRGQTSTIELQSRLRALESDTVIRQYWDILTSDPQSAPCFEVLQLLSSLDGEMKYQVERYGESSLWDDLTELQNAVQRVRNPG
jgi:hypothetical protein